MNPMVPKIFTVLVYLYSFSSIVIELENINIRVAILESIDADYFQYNIDGRFESDIIPFLNIIQSCDWAYLVECCRLPPSHWVI